MNKLLQTRPVPVFPFLPSPTFANNFWVKKGTVQKKGIRCKNLFYALLDSIAEYSELLGLVDLGVCRRNGLTSVYQFVCQCMAIHMAYVMAWKFKLIQLIQFAPC